MKYRNKKSCISIKIRFFAKDDSHNSCENLVFVSQLSRWGFEIAILHFSGSTPAAIIGAAGIQEPQEGGAGHLLFPLFFIIKL